MLDDELTTAIREVRERIRARHPEGSLGPNGIRAADLTPLVHARDSAEAKVAAIGTVNPRRRGPLNAIVQSVKRLVARALDWHIREQVEFNRGVMACVDATLEALTETNRALAAVTGELHRMREETLAANQQSQADWQSLREEVDLKMRQMNDLSAHWVEWRTGYEATRSASEIHLLRTVAEMQREFQHRVTLLDEALREWLSSKVDQYTIDVQKRLWADLETIRGNYERLIHSELKTIRQKASAHAGAFQEDQPRSEPPALVKIDWLRFAERFRGSQERVRESHSARIARFQGAKNVLDLGCGRGEFLEAARAAGVAARGIDVEEECVALCRSKGLEVEKADMFEYLGSLPDVSLDGVHCSQVIEHLPPDRLPDLIGLLAKTMQRDAPVVFETPNPECLAIFATHFYIDPTHVRPIPSQLLAFYLEEAGFGLIEVERVEPAVADYPALREVPDGFRDVFFGGLDYVLSARKL